MNKIIGVTVGTPLSADKLKEKIKPVTSVNGVKADASGNVKVQGGVSMEAVETYVSGVVGDIDTLLDDINGEVV